MFSPRRDRAGGSRLTTVRPGEILSLVDEGASEALTYAEPRNSVQTRARTRGVRCFGKECRRICGTNPPAAREGHASSCASLDPRHIHTHTQKHSRRPSQQYVNVFYRRLSNGERLQYSRQRAHPDLNQGPADLQSAALATELCTLCHQRLSFERIVLLAPVAFLMSSAIKQSTLFAPCSGHVVDGSLNYTFRAQSANSTNARVP